MVTNESKLACFDLPPVENGCVNQGPSNVHGLRDVRVNEGERAHFEAKVGPVGDPSMVVEWYYNGNIITASKCRS